MEHKQQRMLSCVTELARWDHLVPGHGGLQPVVEHANLKGRKSRVRAVNKHNTAESTGERVLMKFKIFEIYLGVDTGVVPLGTSVAPGHDTLQLTVAHDGATGVTLRTESGEGEMT